MRAWQQKLHPWLARHEPAAPQSTAPHLGGGAEAGCAWVSSCRDSQRQWRPRRMRQGNRLQVCEGGNNFLSKLEFFATHPTQPRVLPGDGDSPDVQVGTKSQPKGTSWLPNSEPRCVTGPSNST